MWRVTTAVRVFGLSLAIGLVLAAESPSGGATPLLVALVVVGGMCCALEWAADGRQLRWLSACEAVLVGVLVASVPAPDGAMAYLAVPAVVAGIRYGIVATVNTAILSAVAPTVTMVGTDLDLTARDATQVATWSLVGLGMGLLANWQSRSLRELQARQAPYAAAHDLMAQLHQLTQQGSVGLDVRSVASELDHALRDQTGATRSAVVVWRRDRECEQIAGHGEGGDLRQHAVSEPGTHPDDVLVLLLEGAGRPVGAVSLMRPDGWPKDLRRAAQELADDYALRLDTAALFDSVRLMATADERNRIAREMHDGVAQEIVALGYLVDEIEASSREEHVRQVASTLRAEVTRLVEELRYSIFDLRHTFVAGHMASAVADYVQEASRDSGMEVHLALDESGPAIPARHQSELLRIVQEAFANVRKHSHADNVWVHLRSDGRRLEVSVEDDGVGNATPRERHWGLQSMQERAAQIGARLVVRDRAPRGTVVEVSLDQNDSERALLP